MSPAIAEAVGRSGCLGRRFRWLLGGSVGITGLRCGNWGCNAVRDEQLCDQTVESAQRTGEIVIVA